MSYQKVGGVLVAQGKLQDALDLYRQSLRIRQNISCARQIQLRLAARSGQGCLCFRPRQISAEAFQAEQAQLLVEVLILEAFAALSLDLMLVT